MSSKSWYLQCTPFSPAGILCFSNWGNIIVLNVECGELIALKRCSSGFKASGKRMLPNIYTTHFALTAHLMRLLAPVSALPLQIGVGVSIEISFTFSQSFFYSCNFSFSVHLQTFLSNELSENLDYSTTFSFSVSVLVSNLFFIIGWFKCFFGHPIRFNEGFWFTFLRFCH